MNTSRTTIVFFVLVLVLSSPFYLLGTLGGRLPGLSILPTSAVMAFVPMIAALALVYRQRGANCAFALFTSSVDFRKRIGIGWYLTAFLFMPMVGALECGVLRLRGSAVPPPQLALGEMLFSLAAVFVGGIGEEVGWQGYAYPGLRSRLNVLAAAVVLGVVWALWHVVPFVQLGRATDWIVWHSLCAVALRIIIVWLFENTGKSVVIAVLFHTMINVSWALFSGRRISLRSVRRADDPDAGRWRDRYAVATVDIGAIQNSHECCVRPTPEMYR